MPFGRSRVVLFLLGCGVLAGAWRCPGADRAPAVEGRFYPESASALREAVARALADCPKREVAGPVRALIAPHAGYVYSAGVAATGYRLIDRSVRRVILLAPSHRHAFDGVSIPEVEAYRNCLGRMVLDPAAAALRRQVGFIRAVPEAHRREHALEVQVPFLQVRLDGATLIPLVLGRCDPEALAAALAPLCTPETLVVASSDLSHYHPYAEARQRDLAMVRAIVAMDGAAVAEGEACGRLPILTVMALARRLGWKPELLDYRNSGDTAGDRTRVVGYASVAFTEGAASRATDGPLSEAQRTFLLKLARSRITAKLTGEAIRLAAPAGLERLQQPGACFVTLTRDGSLRGCIGSLTARRPLLQDVADHAVNAAFRDHRFSPLTLPELPDIRIGISVLTAPVPLPYDGPEELVARLRPGLHGVTVSDGDRRATFLPQVWEQLPDAVAFLSRLCRKAGMETDRWRRQPWLQVSVYEVNAFGEPE